MNKITKLKYFSIFSGIGGFEYGIEQSCIDATCVGHSEINKYAESIYQAHYGGHNYGDANYINTSELPEFNFLVGGFPCQSFSSAGYQMGFDDTRGTLFFEIARILKDKRPQYILLENVKNLLSHDGGNTFHKITQVLAELGYVLEWKIYNSKDYQTPQHRERIYIRGHLASIGGGSPKLLPFEREGGKSIKRIFKEEMTQINENSDFNQTNDGRKINIIGNSIPSGHNTANVFDDKGLFPTLKRCHYKDPPKVKVTLDGKDRVRRLTPLECERLQGFPDDYSKFGVDGEVISKTQRYQCLGNAVTPTVITYIINQMFSGTEYDKMSISGK